MWARSDFEDILDSYKAGSSASSPGWVPGCESAWLGSSSMISGSNRARRHSAASDSADTGIGTSCSDSVEDHSSSSGTLSFQPLRSQGPIPTAHVMPSPSSSRLSTTPSVPGSSWSQLSSPVSSSLDMKDPRPVRRWSSLTRLNGQEKNGRPSPCHSTSHGSLDRSLLHSRTDAPCSSPLKPSTLDLTYSALPESRVSVRSGHRGTSLAHQAVGGSPIQPSVRTQMWLSEQMEFTPDNSASWQNEQPNRERTKPDGELSQMLGGSTVPVNTLVKIKEGLLRQRELEIDRQKQQILQLHARIRENELRAQQVILNRRSDDPYLHKNKETSLEIPTLTPAPQTPVSCENGELGRKLATAELEVLHLNEFLKQNTQKYTEDIKKLEEKMKTRDRYISSLKKKCQREQEQNLEKQQRIETLEKYLADLPSLDEVQTQTQQLMEVQVQTQTLQDSIKQLECSLEESRQVLQEKDVLIVSQSKREAELLAAVHSLQEKVEECLEDGVRLPMLNLKQLERENTRLLEQHTHNNTLIDSQKQQIDKLTTDLTTLEKRLNKERALTQELHTQLEEREEDLKTLSKNTPQHLQQVDGGAVVKEVSSLLQEMSLCLLDLKALCSILTQRAQGKEPNLALLLGIKSMSCSSDDGEKPQVEDGLRTKLLEVNQLRKDIDDLRNVIADRYAQDMGENCVTQ